MVIKKPKGFFVVSEKTGRNLGGPYKSEDEAKKRLKQVEFFKVKEKRNV
jgi:hypothetical protein